MLVVVREGFAALFRIDDFSFNDADRERIAPVVLDLMGPIADVLHALGRRPFRVCARYEAEKEAGTYADQQQGLTKTV